MFSLQDQVALVTGAGNGIGRAIAIAYARGGAHVAVAGRNPQPLAEVAAQVTAAGRRALACPVDVRAVPDVRALVQRVVETFGRLDVLVNNAGITHRSPSLEVTEEAWDAVMETNLKGLFFCCQAAAAHMIPRRRGRIINVSSRTVKSPQAELGLSNGSRAALIGFAAGLARETVRHNVTINNILPGIFDSDAQREHIRRMVPMTGKSFEQMWEERARATPAGRYGRVEEFGGYCAFLCSAQAGYITGQNLLIDGGAYPGTF